MGHIKLTNLGPSGMTTRSKFTLVLIIRCPLSGAIIAATSPGAVCAQAGQSPNVV